jgi:hypothetical protein
VEIRVFHYYRLKTICASPFGSFLRFLLNNTMAPWLWIYCAKRLPTNPITGKGVLCAYDTVGSHGQFCPNFRRDELRVLALQVFIGDPTGLAAAASDIEGDAVVNRLLK